jgi:hypothetical protein
VAWAQGYAVKEAIYLKFVKFCLAGGKNCGIVNSLKSKNYKLFIKAK